MDKKIIFMPDSIDESLDQYLEMPQPSKNFLPEWWKNQPLLIDENSDQPSFRNLSFKACLPFLDTLTYGYMATTHQDIQITEEFGTPLVKWNSGPDPVIFRSDKQMLPVPTGYYEYHFAWRFPFGVELPKGYSMIFTHPLNRFDLPFMTVSGIIDDGVPWGGQFTFWIKKGFVGTIPKNTPFVQIIPFKSENWQSEKQMKKDYSKKMRHERDRLLSGYYKKYIYRKKHFK